MDIPFGQVLAACLGFGLGNFLYQAFHKREWPTAVFATYSQWVAIIVCWLMWSG